MKKIKDIKKTEDIKDIKDVKKIDELNIEEFTDFVEEIGSISNDSVGAKIELVDISKKYEGNDKYTLENINLEIPSGNFTVFLGPSGCGKTTLLRMIAGLNSVTRGDLLFDGKKFNNLTPSERDIAMVFQSYALYPHMSVYKNMSFGLRLARERKDIIDRRVKDAAKILKIDSHLYNKPRDLSGGQRQRVAIGRAIVRKPSLFLMDEPLSNLDAKLREDMRRELVELHRMLNTTSIYVTHDQLEAMTMGDQIVVINDGAIQQNAKPKELYFEPANLFVAEFIGSPTMNLFDAEVKGSNIIAPGLNYQVAIPAGKKASLSSGQKLKIGVRSENVLITKTKKASGITGIIKNIEILGKEQQLVVTSGKEKIVITASNSLEFTLGEDIHLEFESSKIHMFDKKSTKRI